MKKKETTKSVCLKLSLDDYKLLETKASQRNLDKSNYLRYLIYRDQDDLYSINAARAQFIILLSQSLCFKCYG